MYKRRCDRGSTLIYHSADPLPGALSPNGHRPGSQPMTQALCGTEKGILFPIDAVFSSRSFYHYPHILVKHPRKKAKECFPYGGIFDLFTLYLHNFHTLRNPYTIDDLPYLLL